MFLPMTIWNMPQSQPVCWPYYWRAYHENHLRGDVIYDIEQGFPVAPKGQLFLNISSNLALQCPSLWRAFPVKVCLCSILQWAAKACYQVPVVFLYFLQHGCGSSYATFAFQLPQSSLLTLTQYAFLATHWPASLRRSAVIVALLWKGRRPVVGNHPDYHPWRSIARDPINDIATSLAVGIALSGVLTC